MSLKGNIVNSFKFANAYNPHIVSDLNSENVVAFNFAREIPPSS